MKTLIFILLSFTGFAQVVAIEEPKTIYKDINLFEIVDNGESLTMFYKDMRYPALNVIEAVTMSSESFAEFFSYCEESILTKQSYSSPNYTIKKELNYVVANFGSPYCLLNKGKIKKMKEAIAY